MVSNKNDNNAESYLREGREKYDLKRPSMDNAEMQVVVIAVTILIPVSIFVFVRGQFLIGACIFLLTIALGAVARLIQSLVRGDDSAHSHVDLLAEYIDKKAD